MTDKNLVKKIRGLRKIEPASDWQSLTRRNLLAQMEAEDDTGLFGEKVSFWSWLKEPQIMSLAFCLALILIAGPWLTIKASQMSLPGDFLYSVKRVSEGVQTTVVSKEDRGQLQVGFAQKRLEELNKITESIEAENAREIASQFKNNLASASIYTSKISKEQAIAIAKRTKKIKNNLDIAKEDAVSEEVKTELAEAEKSIEEINHNILTALTGEEEGGLNISSTTENLDEEIIILLEELDLTINSTTDPLPVILERAL